MDRSLYIGMTSAKHNMLGQAIRSNNLANANTNGFRADLEQARSMGVYYGDGHPTRAFALTENPHVDFSPGALIKTGNDLDVAIKGEGFIAVEAPDGREAYTRLGSLTTNSLGQLITGNNLPVLGSAGPIVLSNYAKAEVAVDGTISIVGQGGNPNEVTQVDRIKLVKPALADIRKGEDGLFYAEQVQFADAGVQVVSGFVEASNVNAIEELTKVLSLSRQYEMSVKVMQTADENSQASARLLQFNS